MKMAGKKSPGKAVEKEIKFEEAILKLEDIVKKLEVNNISLEESLQLFENGVGLVGQCHQELNRAEEKVKVLSLKNSSIEEKDFILEERGM
jgi:exodeoxyribonuclease VII small subunit